MCSTHDDEITNVICETSGIDMYVCNNCGADSVDPLTIKHHKGCKPGDAKFWKDFYSEEGGE